MNIPPTAPESRSAEVYMLDREVVAVSLTFRFRDLGQDDFSTSFFFMEHNGCGIVVGGEG